jgi:hypothetical protein
MMNRQIRRAQAKQDKKAERDKLERREARKRKVEQLRAKRAERRTAIRTGAKSAAKDDAKDGAKDGAAGGSAVQGPKRGGRGPGRFSGALMMATVFFIVLQSSVPPEEGGNEVLRLVTGAGFFLLFGYFSAMWLMRRSTPRPLTMTWITGALLIVGVEVAKAIQGLVPFDPLLVVLSLPAVVAGSYLGRLVFENTPS